MAKKEQKKEEKIEREYVIPLREKVRPVPRYKKTPKAIKSIKEFLAKHMKVRDRDLKKIKIDPYLNEQIWIRGIKRPIHKIKVKVVKEEDIFRVYSTELPAKINFKKIREEKLEEKAKAEVEKQKTMMEKAKESLKGGKKEKEKTETKETSKEKEGQTKEKAEEKTEEEKKEEKEKETASKLAQEKLEKEQAKKMKHTTKVKTQKQKSAEKQSYNATSRGH